jgi:hypothetical protein
MAAGFTSGSLTIQTLRNTSPDQLSILRGFEFRHAVPEGRSRLGRPPCSTSVGRNGDGVITLDEWLAAKRTRESFATSIPRIVRPTILIAILALTGGAIMTERSHRRTAMPVPSRSFLQARAAAFFKAMDRNGDGVITLDQWLATSAAARQASTASTQTTTGGLLPKSSRLRWQPFSALMRRIGLKTLERRGVDLCCFLQPRSPLTNKKRGSPTGDSLSRTTRLP